MSYDFELYTQKTCLPEPPGIGGGAVVRVDGPDCLQDEDIPENHAPVVGKKRMLFRLHLEGQLSQNDQNKVDAWLTQTVSQTKGVLIDLQTERFETPTRFGHLGPQATQPSKTGWMTFYFEDGETFLRQGFEKMLGEIAQLMPEALPVRYGSYEPLQGRLEGGGFADLVQSFKADPKLIMKAKTPFGHIFQAVPCQKTFEEYHPTHFIRRKFLLSRVCFELRAKLFETPALFDRLMALFEALSVRLNVVYAEIVQADKWGSWFWYGLPDNEAHTICVGPAYQKVWPDVTATGRRVGTHHHLVTTDRFGMTPPSPPRALVAPDQRGKNPREAPDYAPTFPFDYQFDFERYIW